VPARPVDENGEANGDGADDPRIASTRGEINGLMERVRVLSHQYKRT
jgi:hypothetical protein